MIIDLSYFARLIQVSSLDKPSIAETVNEFIVQYEPEYLTRMLGYQLAQDFLTGLQQQSTIDQKWLDLLIGQTYTDGYGRTQKWGGLAASYSYPNTGADQTIYNWIVGLPGGPVAGEVAYSDSKLINRNFFIERNGSGTMIKLLDDGSNSTLADYRFYNSTDLHNNIPAGNIKLLKPGISFQPNEVYTIHLTGYNNAINAATVNFSPIAYYTYFMMVKDIEQQQSGLGVQTRSKAENAEIVSPYPTMVNVWNKMVDLSRSLTDFLNANSTTYSSYYPASYYGNCSQNELLVKLNIHGI